MLSNYDYPLPPGLIATAPASPREAARLLVYERASGRITHAHFADLPQLLPPCELILNDTRVIKARLLGRKKSGGAVELFYHRVFDDSSFFKKNEEKKFELAGGDPPNPPLPPAEGLPPDPSQAGGLSLPPEGGCGCPTLFLAGLRGRVRVGEEVFFADNLVARVEGRGQKTSAEEGVFLVSFSQRGLSLDEAALLKMLEKIGHPPLPPYILKERARLAGAAEGSGSGAAVGAKYGAGDGSANLEDEEHYQSIFAAHPGAVAAPTASLHFSEGLLGRLGRGLHFLTLHVGAGTFRPIKCEDITRHKMHAEAFFIPEPTRKIISSQARLCCVGTTAARAVEYFARTGLGSGECDLFLHPGNPPRRIDYLITNFHLPRSSLLLLVSSLIGRQRCLLLYAEAVKLGYRFYSYGDGILIL